MRQVNPIQEGISADIAIGLGRFNWFNIKGLEVLFVDWKKQRFLSVAFYFSAAVFFYSTPTGQSRT